MHVMLENAHLVHYINTLTNGERASLALIRC